MIRVFNVVTDDLMFVMPHDIVPPAGTTIDVDSTEYLVEDVRYVARHRRDIAAMPGEQVRSITQIDIYVQEVNRE